MGQLLTENLLLTAVAGALAVAVAWWGVDLLRGLAPPGLPRLSEIRVDGRVLAFTALVSTATALFFGLTPAWLATAAGSLLTLRDGGKSSASRRRHRFGSALVVSETALSICLLIGATLLIESLWKTVHADPGFRTRGIISTQMMLPANNGLGRNLAFVEQVIESVRALPGVDAAGVISELPLSGEHNDTGFSIVEHPPRSPQQRDGADFRRVTPDYFDTMGIALLRGRSFDRHDRPDSQPVVIIDEPFARSFFPGEEPIGKHIQLWAACEIVGVVSGVRTHSLQLPPRPILYLPASQEMPDSLHVVVRAAGDPAALVNPIRGVVAARNPDVALSAFQSMDDLIAGSLAAQRFTSLLLGAFAALALVLAMAGVYGVFSYVVSQQTRTIGVRMALGAQPGQMLWMVLRRGICLSAAGAALGLSAAIFLVQVLATQLYEVQPRDPITFAASALALIGVAVGACALPARRAMRVDPLVALRYE